jgi:hypothetical protein
MKPVTEKQMVAINNVEKVLRVKFEGKTKQDAFLWMRENMPKVFSPPKLKSRNTKSSPCLKSPSAFGTTKTIHSISPISTFR